MLEKVPVALLPDDIKEKFDTLVDPIRSLNVDAVAGEVESWFDLQDGEFPFEPTLEAALADVRTQLDALITDVEPFNPRNLGQTVDPLCQHDWVEAVGVDRDEDFPEEARVVMCRLCGLYAVTNSEGSRLV